MTNEQIFHKTMTDIDDGKNSMAALIDNLGNANLSAIENYLDWCEQNGHLELVEVING